MWPNLIPGDVLSSVEIQVTNLKPGMIAVFNKGNSTVHVVHRVLKVSKTIDEIIVESGGDRSGPDDCNWHFQFSDQIVSVTGVLRRGRYCPVRSVSVSDLLSPSIVVRIYNRIIRKLFW